MTKNKCWECRKPTKHFRCLSCAKRKTTFSVSDRPDLNRVIERGVKVKDLMQPYNKDGSRNYEFQSRYGDKIYDK